MSYLLLSLIGLMGGFVGGLFGVGGGILFVPLLILLYKCDPHVAIGTSLAVIVPTALSGTLKNVQAGTVDWKIFAVLAALAIAGSWLGATVSLQLNTLLLKRFYAGFLFLLALKLFFSK